MLTESQRSHITRDMTPANLTRLYFNLAINRDNAPQYQQQSRQIVDNIKKTLTKVNPDSEIVTNNECLELVIAILLL